MITYQLEVLSIIAVNWTQLYFCAIRCIGITLPSFCLYIYICNKTSKIPDCIYRLYILVAHKTYTKVQMFTMTLRLNNLIPLNVKVISLDSIVISLKVLRWYPFIMYLSLLLIKVSYKCFPNYHLLLITLDVERHLCSLNHLHFVRMMLGVSSIVPNINTERVKGIL